MGSRMSEGMMDTKKCDICADCFPTVLKKLAREINKMEDAS